MGMPAPDYDPRAVIDGRAPGRAPVGVIIGIVVAALCVLIVFAVELGESLFDPQAEHPRQVIGQLACKYRPGL